nr:RNA-directed DNA polymerase, eukaryota [Tanacetum cinerariifolium]
MEKEIHFPSYHYPQRTTEDNHDDNNDDGWHTATKRQNTKEYGTQHIITPYFFTDFPQGLSETALWKTFAKYGRITDVYIAKKPTINEKAFGFARFINVQNLRSFETTLNSIVISTYHLKVNIARFQRVTKPTSSLDTSISDNESNIQRCNNRLLNSISKSTTNKDIDDEVLKTIEVGSLLGFNMPCIAGFMKPINSTPLNSTTTPPFTFTNELIHDRNPINTKTHHHQTPLPPNAAIIKAKRGNKYGDFIHLYFYTNDICHEPNSEGSGSAWKEYVNARVAGLFLLYLTRVENSIWHHTGRELGWMAGPYRCKDATRGRNDDPVTSGIRARLDRGGPKQNRLSCSPQKFLKVLVAQRWRE